eukprot:3830986-Pleurochrysis_carterae.AAC.1
MRTVVEAEGQGLEDGYLLSKWAIIRIASWEQAGSWVNGQPNKRAADGQLSKRAGGQAGERRRSWRWGLRVGGLVGGEEVGKYCKRMERDGIEERRAKGRKD